MQLVLKSELDPGKNAKTQADRGHRNVGLEGLRNFLLQVVQACLEGGQRAREKD